jgi:Mg2+/Co2+ transporter CorB
LDYSDIIYCIVLAILLYFSSFFSATETALTTANKIKMKKLAEEGNKKAMTVLKLNEEPSKMLSVILIGNNIVNILASSLATVLATKHFKDYGAGISTGVMTFLVLIFGEVTPKSRATAKANRDWATADALRAEIDAAGWTVLDGKDGYKIVKKA